MVVAIWSVLGCQRERGRVRQGGQVTLGWDSRAHGEKKKESQSDRINIARVILRELLVPLTSAFFRPPHPLFPVRPTSVLLSREIRCELPHPYKPSISRLCMIVKGGSNLG